MLSEQYVVSGVELIFNETINDWALTDGLVPNEDYFEFYGVFFMCCQTQLFVEFRAHP